MEKVVTECKNCGSDLKFDPIKRTLNCEYCETSYHLPKSKINAVLVRGYSNSFHPNQFNKSLNAYRCDMCGHTYFSASQEKATECLSCGSSKCSEIQSSGYCADGIIPFEISNEKAINLYDEYLKSKPWLSKSFVKKAKNQKFKGVFVPVWNFIFDVDAVYSASAVELKKDERGSYYSIPFPIFATKSESIKSADQCATNNENDILLELFDERDYDKIIPYSAEYTFGYKVDEINRSIHQYYEVVAEAEQEKLKKEIKRHLYSKYKDVTNIEIETTLKDIYFNFTYVPVYMSSFEYKKKTYKTYISGTSGKIASKTPSNFNGFFKGLVKVLGLVAAVALIYFLLKN